VASPHIGPDATSASPGAPNGWHRGRSQFMTTTRPETIGIQPDGALVEELAATLRGPVLRPDDSGYDDARRIWNGMIDKRPALIARCTGTADVVSAVTLSPASPACPRGEGWRP